MPRSSRLTAYPAPKSTDRHAPSNPARAGSFSGHKDAFPRPRPNDRSLFSQATFAGAGGNDEDAPIAAIRRSRAFGGVRAEMEAGTMRHSSRILRELDD
jgi:hypothetical protein